MGKTKAKLKKYTVLMLYPDYIASQYGEESYLAHVKATDPITAIAKAQLKAAKDNQEECNDPQDFGVLFACEGHRNDVSGEVQEAQAAKKRQAKADRIRALFEPRAA